MANGTDVKTVYLLSPVDDILEKIGLPKTRPLLDAVSPEEILGRKMGIRSPGEILEGMLRDVEKGAPSGMRLPRLPGM